MMSAKKVAELFCVSVQTIYNWEAKGLLKPSYMSISGRRFYDENYVKRILRNGFDAELSEERTDD